MYDFVEKRIQIVYSRKRIKHIRMIGFAGSALRGSEIFPKIGGGGGVAFLVTF